MSCLWNVRGVSVSLCGRAHLHSMCIQVVYPSLTKWPFHNPLKRARGKVLGAPIRVREISVGRQGQGGHGLIHYVKQMNT